MKSLPFIVLACLWVTCADCSNFNGAGNSPPPPPPPNIQKGICADQPVDPGWVVIDEHFEVGNSCVGTQNPIQGAISNELIEYVANFAVGSTIGICSDSGANLPTGWAVTSGPTMVFNQCNGWMEGYGSVEMIRRNH